MTPTSTDHPLYLFIKQVFTERLSKASWQQTVYMLVMVGNDFIPDSYIPIVKSGHTQMFAKLEFLQCDMPFIEM